MILKFLTGRALWIVIGLLAGSGLIAGVWWHGHSHGVRACQEDLQAAVDRERAAQRHLADALQEATHARETRTREVVRTIYLEPDPTGCADADALPGVLDALREDGAGPAPD